MAGFTTMALLGLAAAGGVFAGRKLGPKPTAQPATLGTDPAQGATPPATTPTPPSTTETASANTRPASTAATRQRKRAQGRGSRALAGTPRTPGQNLLRPAVEPRTLLGY